MDNRTSYSKRWRDKGELVGLAGAAKHSGEFMCPDGVVTLKMEAMING